MLHGITSPGDYCDTPAATHPRPRYGLASAATYVTLVPNCRDSIYDWDSRSNHDNWLPWLGAGAYVDGPR